MLRRSFLYSSLPVAFAQAAPRPNILWLSCEDSSPQAFGCYGDPNAYTPNIDGLARRGIRYTHCYSTYGVCAPTRSGIITGMSASSLGSHFMRCSIQLPPDIKCFPEYLRNAGYYCTNNSKTDYNFPVPKAAWDESSNKAHFRNRPAGKPFFAVFNYTMTHESPIRETGKAHLDLTPNVPASARVNPAKLQVPPIYPDTPIVRQQIANWYECVSEFDFQAGKILAQLAADGLADNTIVFMWGDHGTGFPRAKRWTYESGTHVPLVVYVPEKLRTSNLPPPNTADPQLVSFTDFAPTVLNLAGVSAPSHFQGRPFLGPNLPPPRQYIYSCHDRMDERYETVRAIRDARYRYIRNYQYFKPYYQYMNTAEGSPIMEEIRRTAAAGTLSAAARQFMADEKPKEELYDVEADPWEVKNLVADPRHKAALERLRAAHIRWQDETKDLGLFPESEVEREEKRLGTRHAILRQPGRENLLSELRNATADPKLLAHKEPSVRYWAATHLANANKPAAAALDDESPAVRIAAAMACLRAGENPKAVQVLKSALGDDSETIRLEAGNAADRLGAKAKLLEPELQAALKDRRNKSTYVPRVTNRILNRLNGTDNKVR